MNLPYYFQYDIVKCTGPNECNCTERHPHIEPIEPVPWKNIVKTITLHDNKTMALDSQNLTDNRVGARLKHINIGPIANGSEPCWTHCLSRISETLWWEVWYVSYEASITFIAFILKLKLINPFLYFIPVSILINVKLFVGLNETDTNSHNNHTKHSDVLQTPQNMETKKTIKGIYGSRSNSGNSYTKYILLQSRYCRSRCFYFK